MSVVYEDESLLDLLFNPTEEFRKYAESQVPLNQRNLPVSFFTFPDEKSSPLNAAAESAKSANESSSSRSSLCRGGGGLPPSHIRSKSSPLVHHTSTLTNHNRVASVHVPSTPDRRSYLSPNEKSQIERALKSDENFTLTVQQLAEQMEMPEGWELQYTLSKEPYFTDHINKTTTWLDPRLQIAEIELLDEKLKHVEIQLQLSEIMRQKEQLQTQFQSLDKQESELRKALEEDVSLLSSKLERSMRFKSSSSLDQTHCNNSNITANNNLQDYLISGEGVQNKAPSVVSNCVNSNGKIVHLRQSSADSGVWVAGGGQLSLSRNSIDNSSCVPSPDNAIGTNLVCHSRGGGTNQALLSNAHQLSSPENGSLYSNSSYNSPNANSSQQHLTNSTSIRLNGGVDSSNYILPNRSVIVPTMSLTTNDLHVSPSDTMLAQISSDNNNYIMQKPNKSSSSSSSNFHRNSSSNIHQYETNLAPITMSMTHGHHQRMTSEPVLQSNSSHNSTIASMEYINNQLHNNNDAPRRDVGLINRNAPSHHHQLSYEQPKHTATKSNACVLGFNPASIPEGIFSKSQSSIIPSSYDDLDQGGGMLGGSNFTGMQPSMSTSLNSNSSNNSNNNNSDFANMETDEDEILHKLLEECMFNNNSNSSGSTSVQHVQSHPNSNPPSTFANFMSNQNGAGGGLPIFH